MPIEPLITYYGDDLTGSTDCMEALALGGVPATLFLRVPDDRELARFGDSRAIGLAGTSRSRPPEWMDRELPPALAWLRGLGAPVCHYKVCSTFDSAPGCGSIGRALDIGHALFGQPVTPVVVGVPQLRRYTAFGHLFAADAGIVHRIDRHPVMSRHPATPMHEADLRLHLSAQTAKHVSLADAAALGRDRADLVDRLMVPGGDEILLLDVLDDETQGIVGAELWRHAARRALFVVGSSGIEYALLRAWHAAGLASPPPPTPSPGSVDRIAVVSGSVSPTTERQIRHALAAGFEGLAVDAALLAAPGDVTVRDLAPVEAALAALAAGRSVILHSALGPGTDLSASGTRLDGEARHQIGRNLGRILQALITRAGLSRAVVAGGDTSSHALGELRVLALRTLMPLPDTPGSPLCTAFSDDAGELQIALKGGQIGADGYFANIRAGVALN